MPRAWQKVAPKEHLIRTVPGRYFPPHAVCWTWIQSRACRRDTLAQSERDCSAGGPLLLALTNTTAANSQEPLSSQGEEPLVQTGQKTAQDLVNNPQRAQVTARLQALGNTCESPSPCLRYVYHFVVKVSLPSAAKAPCLLLLLRAFYRYVVGGPRLVKQVSKRGSGTCQSLWQRWDACMSFQRPMHMHESIVKFFNCCSLEP